MAPRSLGGLRRAGVMLAAFAALSFALSPAEAVQPTKDKKTTLLQQGFSDVHLDATPSLTTFHGREVSAAALAQSPGLAALDGFFGEASRDWEVRWDARGDRPHLIQGAGYPLLPGAGNRLSYSEVGLDVGRKIGRDDVEGAVRGFMARYPDLLRVDPATLRLDPVRSVTVGNGRVWFIELQQFYRGVPVEGANVFFRINNGNIVQFGADRIGDVRGIHLVPRSDREPAFAAVLQQLGIDRSQVSEILDAGTLKIYPGLAASEQPGHEYSGWRGSGYTHRMGWEFTFRRKGDTTTYQAVVDARTHALLRIVDLTRYASVTAGIYPTTNTDPETVVNMPFCTVSNNGTKVTDAGGAYNYTGGTATASLNGQYFTMSDACGAISLSNSTDGNLNFGTSGGTDCTTPGVGGAGNTHASRSGFYHLTNINRKAAGFFPANSWLAGNVTANMNINQTCNAFWNGSTLNFYRSGGGCSNTGEIAAVFLHEWGHGMDTNSGGAASESGSGEAVGDTFAFLETKDSCIGQNFQPGVNCANCTNCTGVRDVGDFSVAGGATGGKIAKPSNVADNTGINCDRYACPYLSQGIFPYQGPMGYEGHCESYIASSANWDLAQNLISAYGTTQGWAAMDQIWYESLTPSKSAYQVASGGTCNPAATVNGCASTNWYTVYLSVDDDDGNLANGTPNGCHIWDAFNAHGIACGSRPACSGGCTPQPVANAGPDQTIAPGGSVTIGTPAQANTTYSWSPGGQTTAQITVSPASTTTYTVTATTTCGSASDSVTVTVQSGSVAVYDATLKAPKCVTVGAACNSGASLLLGRDGKGPEPNQPNTINNSCADGTSGTFHSDESNDALKVETLDGTNLAPGKSVRVSATVWAWTTPSSDHLDLYYAADATSPSWTLITTLTPTAAGAQQLSATYTLPSGGSLQAVRANFRYQGSASSCSAGAYDDRDDLIFAVGAGAPDTTPPTTSITAPANGATVSGTTTVSASASDNVGVSRVEFYVDGVLKSTDTTSPYSFAWDTTTYSNASHSLLSKAYDAANNVGTSATVTVTVNNGGGGGPVTVFSDGAESATTTLSFSSTTTNTQWFRNNTSAYAGSWRYRAGDPANPTGNYGNNGDARMTTPALDLTGATTATLTYAFKHNTETSFDFFEVRISTDGGSNWTNLVHVSGNSANWNLWAPLASINLNAYTGNNNVKIQFRLTTDVSVVLWGAAVDEIKVVKQ